MRSTYGVTTKADVEQIAHAIRGYFSPNGFGYRRGHIPFPLHTQVSVQGRSIRIALSRPVTFLPHLLGLPYVSPPPQGGTEGRIAPFFLTRQEKDSYILTPNEAISQGRFPDSVEMRVIKDNDHALALFERGELDMTSTTGLGQVAAQELRDHPRLTSRALSIFGNLEFGAHSASLRSDAELRIGIARVLDCRRLADVAPDLLIGHPESLHAEKTPDQATKRKIRKALTKANRIIYADFPPNGGIVSAVVSTIRSEFGVSLHPEALSLPQYARRMASSNFALAYTLTVPEFEHPAAALMPWHSRGTAARGAEFSDARLDEILESAAAVRDGQGECWNAASRRLREVIPRIPLTQTISKFLIDPSWSHISFTGMGAIRVESYAKGQ
ncbi:hypothetical protein OHT76_05645 [Streptomyces sp. NBC_00287]|uniref:hypothetical protein n=1 Tax=Streptomyces sp. NBC_00287 TaxID=2975702 RepID=UPI002E292331|nr:hypothetical protein [Streptomyces sp. NBC_00287]